MSKEEIVKAIEIRLEDLRIQRESEIAHSNFFKTNARIDELESLLEYIENPRIK